jgi:hypothetical protein
MTGPHQAARNLDHLRDRLPFAEDHFRHPLPNGPMMVHRGKAEVFKRERPESAGRRLHPKPAFSHLRQQTPYPFRRHT